MLGLYPKDGGTLSCSDPFHRRGNGSAGRLPVSAGNLWKTPNHNLEITNRHFKDNPVKSSPENVLNLVGSLLWRNFIYFGKVRTYRIASEYSTAVPPSSYIRWW